MDLASGFDIVLSRFLDKRNTIVHDIERIPGYDIRTKDGLGRVEAYAIALIRDSETVLRVFGDLLSRWAQQVGGPPPPPKIATFIGEFDGIADAVFLRKE